MENQTENQVETQPKNQKSGKGKTVAIIILVSLVLGLGGYIAYDKVFTKETKEIEKTEKKVADSSTPTEEETTKTKLGTNRVIQNLQFHFGPVEGNAVVSKDGNAYVEFYESKSDDDNVTKASLANLKRQYQDYNIEGYHEYMTEPGENKAFNGIKLPVSDVVAAYEGYSGNGGSQGWYLYLVKTDGTISGFSMGNTFEQNNGNIKFENNINNLTNISSIAQSMTSSGRSEAFVVIAVEKDGTEHILKTE